MLIMEGYNALIVLMRERSWAGCETLKDKIKNG